MVYTQNKTFMLCRAYDPRDTYLPKSTETIWTTTAKTNDQEHCEANSDHIKLLIAKVTEQNYMVTTNTHWLSSRQLQGGSPWLPSTHGHENEWAGAKNAIPRQSWVAKCHRFAMSMVCDPGRSFATSPLTKPPTRKRTFHYSYVSKKMSWFSAIKTGGRVYGNQNEKGFPHRNVVSES